MSQPVPVVPDVTDDVPIHTRRVLLALKTSVEYLLTQTGVRTGRAGTSVPTTSVSTSFVHNGASGLQGGTSGQYYHLTQVQLSGLTGGANTTLHYHEADRALENATGVLPWDQVDKTGATLADFDSITHNDINSIQGGSASERYHLTAAQWTATTQGVDNTIHFHSSDRALGNATGLLPWTQIDGVPDHNDLTNSQGGTTDEYYHLTSAEYTGTGTGTFVRATSPALSTPDVDGGTIDGAAINSTAIGATTASSGAFTTLSATGRALFGTTTDDGSYQTQVVSDSSFLWTGSTGAALARWRLVTTNGVGATLQADVTTSSALLSYVPGSGASTILTLQDGGVEVSGNSLRASSSPTFPLAATAPTLDTNSSLTFELTSDTSLKLSVRGTDGTTRSVSLTLT